MSKYAKRLGNENLTRQVFENKPKTVCCSESFRICSESRIELVQFLLELQNRETNTGFMD